jgi:hypothetical protein
MDVCVELSVCLLLNYLCLLLNYLDAICMPTNMFFIYEFYRT